MHKIITGGSNSRSLARKIAKQVKQRYADLDVKKFPDGDTYVKFPINVRNSILTIVNSMHPNPNDALVEILFACHTARELGASKIILIIPYLAYMRQDKRFHEGEAVSNKIIAKLLECCDELITVDPHLHRIRGLHEIFPRHIRAISLTAVRQIADYISKFGNLNNVEFIGPDIESSQWADRVAHELGRHAIILHKHRYSSHSVRTKIRAENPVKGKTVILVDDIISTGHTMIEPIKQLKALGAKKIYCIAVHGVFADDALSELQKLGAKVVCTNTIENKVARIDVTELFAKAL